jgi:hypothetical protein
VRKVDQCLKVKWTVGLRASSTTSLGQPYTSLPDDSSETDVDTDSNLNLLSSLNDVDSDVHQLETPESSVHRVPMTSIPWMNSPVTDSLANSIVKGFMSEKLAILYHFDRVFSHASQPKKRTSLKFTIN